MTSLLRERRWRLLSIVAMTLLMAAFAVTHIPKPVQAATGTYCVAGSFNSWDPGSIPLYDDGTNGDALAMDGIYSTDYTVTSTDFFFEWKIVGNCDWSSSYPASDNAYLFANQNDTVTFTFDTNSYDDGFVPTTNIHNVIGSIPINGYTAVGDWQGWSNSNAATAMSDLGNGIYQLTYSGLSTGSYIGKVSHTNFGDWHGYGGEGMQKATGSTPTNIPFTIDNPGDDLVVTLNTNTGRLKFGTLDASDPFCAAGDFDGDPWDNTENPMNDRGLNGDALANDGIYSREVTIPTAGRWQYKIYDCGSWDNGRPAPINAFFDTSAPNQVVTFTFDTNTYNDSFYPTTEIHNVLNNDWMAGPFTAIGNFQSEAGGSDYDNADPATALSNVGGGIWQGEFTLSNSGNYSGRVVKTGTWDRVDEIGIRPDQFGLDFDIPFGVGSDPLFVTLNTNTGRVSFNAGVDEIETVYCAAGEWQGSAWNPSVDQMNDNGVDGDLAAGDGIYTYEFVTTQQPGTYGWKVAENCNWGVEYPGGFGQDSWYRVTSPGQTIKLMINTNDLSGDVFKPDTNPLTSNDLDGADFVVTGSFQPGGLPDSSDTNFQMVDDGSDPNDTSGDGIYTLTLEGLAQGGYTAQIAELNGAMLALDENLGRLRNAGALLVIVGSGGSDVIFQYDSTTSRIHVDVQNASTGIDNNLLWNDMYHDSRASFYRSPGGPIDVDGVNDEVTIRFRTAKDDAEIVLFRYFDDYDNTNHIFAMNKASSDASYDYYEVTLPAPTGPNAYYYWFLAIDGSAQAYYQDAPDPGGVLTGGTGQARGDNADQSWQITYYHPDFETPDWVHNAVIYQIFPERFRDGDSSNNPTAGQFFYDEPYGTIVRSLDSDWNTPVCDPRDVNNNGCDNSYSRNFYGGDLQGITDMIEAGYFTDLGVTALYLNPIFESPSNHKYDTFDFMEVDDNFGGKQAYDDMIAAADAAGIHIILDGVFNHASSDSVYFDRYERWDVNGNSTGAPGAVDDNSGACEDETGTTSPWADWFNFFPYAGTETAPCDGDRDYPYWFGIFDSLAVYDSDSPAVQDYFYADGLNSVGPYWIDQGAAGWRLDVAPEIDHGALNDPSDLYWEGFRDALHAVDPDAYIVGEEWAVATSWVVGGDNGTGPVGEWDATMNYQFGAAAMSFYRDTELTDNDFNDGSSARKLTPLTPSQWNERMLNLMERYPPEALAAMMNLIGSHDTNRALFLLNHDPNLQGNPAQAEADMLSASYDWSDAIERLKGVTLIQMTMPGAPTIYYGNEVGLIGPVGHDGSQWQDDPYNRQPYPWLDETGTPLYTHLQSASSQQELFDYFALLANTRNAHPVLRTGEYKALVLDDANMVLAYARYNQQGDLAVVVINRGNATRDVTIDLTGLAADGTALSDVFSDKSYGVLGGNITVKDLPAQGEALLVSINLPEAPTFATAIYKSAAHNGSLSWGAENAETIIIERSKNGGPFIHLADLSGSATRYTDETVVCGQSYTYRLTASNPYGTAYSLTNTMDVVCDIFADVPTDLPAPFMEDWVNQFSKLGITQGCAPDASGNPQFCPDRNVTRAEMAVFILRAMGVTPVDDPTDPFADIDGAGLPPSFEAYIETFYNLGITQGCGFNEQNELIFCPNREINRAETAVFMVKALGVTPADDPTDPFSDIYGLGFPPSFEAYIETFYNLGITTGCAPDASGNPQFCPLRQVTRADMAVFILRGFDDLPDPNDP